MLCYVSTVVLCSHCCYVYTVVMYLLLCYVSTVMLCICTCILCCVSAIMYLLLCYVSVYYVMYLVECYNHNVVYLMDRLISDVSPVLGLFSVACGNLCPMSVQF